MPKLLIPLIVILLFSCATHADLNKELARNPETLLTFYKNCIVAREFDLSFFVFDKEFQELVPRAVYGLVLGNFAILREFIETLELGNLEKGDNESAVKLKSARFGLTIDLRITKMKGSKIWLFSINKEELDSLINKFWKWHELQLQSADYHRYAYPRDWKYKELK